MIGNQVEVEIEDISLSGYSAEIYKINPKLLGLVKINLGKWGLEDFHERKNYSRNFELT